MVAYGHAPVVQWIERGLAEPVIQVRILAGAQGAEEVSKRKLSTPSPIPTGNLWDRRWHQV